tara:strand:+ start:683 stop:1081 length:399 start_codon:yes stop_codon:yes gene_type:complete
LKNINIITPPDVLHHDAVEILLLCPSDNVKNDVQQSVVDIDNDINIYVYEPNDKLDDNDLDWILNIFQKSQITIIEIDNVPAVLQPILSYMIAKPKTFWLTNGNNRVYNKLSNNRVNDFEFLSNLGGNFEAK